jgi:(4S)-4-hydroxy-5-phosphonooxypentane-2,3-dione isomerase
MEGVLLPQQLGDWRWWSQYRLERNDGFMDERIADRGGFTVYFQPIIQYSLIYQSTEVYMLAVHVFIQVKPDCVERFIEATIENAEHSLKETGIARFDLIQQQDDLTRFVLVEVYRNAEAPARHKETAHYARWRDTVADMMAVPRTSTKFETLYPDESGWSCK